MTYEVTIEPLGQTIEVEEGQNILDAALRAGIWLPHACCHGLCATCKVQIVDGEVDLGEASPFALMDMERTEGKALACCAIPQSDLTIEVEIDEDPDAKVIPLRDFEATVESIVDLTPTIKGIFLRVEEGMEFQAGQYINLYIPGLPEPRAFSIASAPSQSNLIELNIRKVPGGVGTSWIHDDLEVGQVLKFSGPLGRFFTRHSDPNSVIFIAGGSGLSSPKSMILELLENGDSRQITLFQGARNSSELYYQKLFEELTQEYPQFRYFPVLSDEPETSEWQGERGFVHEAAIRIYDNDFRNHKAYLCGPPPMIEAAIRGLMRGRLFERDIHIEKFLSAADAANQATRSPLFRNI
ncbi:phenol 2-monooxygenase domain-containing protein [Acinetobacter sp. ANC 5414]|uniref:NADH:ubiquinone reductase (Na(+)-transporting) subunit F n=1 Tax=Acinetobacter sp. ANC 5414 TaxID=2731251 RepID=UPI0014903174|nr:phenol 2-monooxygenase domain-containing protein [Acinetobacter sp. ANC 5414]NNG99840.1 2Fe-2S iron-sulfur cluster binding domain-containing protein [Acinetobacter sp. ANC 5414]